MIGGIIGRNDTPMTFKWLKIQFNIHDLWIGVYWRRTPFTYPYDAVYIFDVYICIIPALPICIRFERHVKSAVPNAENMP